MDLRITQKSMIITERLEIKPLSSDDTDTLVEMLTNSELTRCFMVPSYDSLDKYRELARKLISFSAPDDTRHLECGVYLEGKLIGFINDCGIDGDTIEIGYAFHPDRWNKGYATEAVRAVLGALKNMGFGTVKAYYFTENPASGRVMEKCGMSPTNEVTYEEYRGVTHECRGYVIRFVDR